MTQENQTEMETNAPLVFDIKKHLPFSLVDDPVAQCMNMAVNAALGIEACLSVIAANDMQNDSHAQPIISMHHQEGLINAAFVAARYISDSCQRCLDKMDNPNPIPHQLQPSSIDPGTD